MSLFGNIGGALMAIPIAAGRLYHVLSNKYAGSFFGGGQAGQQQDGKVVVTEQTALTLSAVWAAVRVISGSIGVLPLHVFMKGQGGAKSDADERTPGVNLAMNPNSEMSAITFWETIIASALTNGNGYAEIERNGAGDPIALWPIPPTRIRPKRDANGVMMFEALDETGQRVPMPAEDVFFLPGLGFDGLLGYSPVKMAARSLGMAATAEQAGSNFFADGMRPGGILEFPGSLQDWQKFNAKQTTKEEHGGVKNFGKRMVLYGGMKYVPLSISPDDAQFLETRAFQVVEIARWFNVPPHMLRDLSRATFSNIESQGIDFVTHTLLYWLTKITQEFDRKVLAGRPGMFSEHCTEALLKGDTIARYTAYGMGRQWGFLSVNDIRRKENESPIPNGDQYLVPVNMMPAGDTPPKPTAPPTLPKQGNQSAEVDPLVVAINRAVSLEICELTANAAEPKTFTEWIDAGYGSTRKFRIMGDVNAAGLEFTAAHSFAAKWIAGRREELNHLADSVTPKELPFAAERLALQWSEGKRQLIEDARRMIA
ncbi:phage portal protein [Zavarzinella formosa]|uniref:phage portal protein n=1 Tax=Zavarzinella formosa TaxID=360055 RepID=UPI0002D302D3|nr:phage portal protein [Zavarzinella formosa]